MYNEIQKEKFLQEYTDSPQTKRIARSLFRVCEQYEKEWGADLCTKSAEDLQEMVDKATGLRAASKWSKLVLLRAYGKWCLENNIPGACAGIRNVDTAGLSELRSKMVSGPAHLQRYMDQVLDSEDKETVDIVFRCYLWMAFGHVKNDDTVLIKNCDVDFDNMIIKHPSGTADIYREAVRAFKLAVSLDRFRYIHPKYSNEVDRMRVPGNEILRGIRGKPDAAIIRSNLSHAIKRAIDEGRTKQQLSFSRVELSGIFYRSYEHERSTGFAPDFAEEIGRIMLEKKFSDDEQVVRSRLARNFMEDYSRWKLAFSV